MSKGVLPRDDLKGAWLNTGIWVSGPIKSPVVSVVFCVVLLHFLFHFVHVCVSCANYVWWRVYLTILFTCHSGNLGCLTVYQSLDLTLCMSQALHCGSTSSLYSVKSWGQDRLCGQMGHIVFWGAKQSIHKCFIDKNSALSSLCAASFFNHWHIAVVFIPSSVTACVAGGRS